MSFLSLMLSPFTKCGELRVAPWAKKALTHVYGKTLAGVTAMTLGLVNQVIAFSPMKDTSLITWPSTSCTDQAAS